MKVALVGQPNCGKSTIFNAVAGYRSATANFPGTTVEVTRGQVRVNGHTIELFDLPGIYSLTASNPVEKATKDFLQGNDVAMLINVVDASLLSRSLELTLELRELGLPMVVCLNMTDEAHRKGIRIYAEQLSSLLRLPVAETVAPRGEGVRELFNTVRLHPGNPPEPAEALQWHRDIESVIEALQHRLPTPGGKRRSNERFHVLKLLEGDEDLLAQETEDVRAAAEALRQELQRSHGRPPESVIMAERHDRAMDLFERAARVGRPQADLREAIDSLLMHPLWGYFFLLTFLLAFFGLVFGLGAALERVLLQVSNAWFARLAAGLMPGTLSYSVARSVWDGVAAGAAIVLPYLTPFLFGLAVLEEVGYLPRVAYLMDGLLHRVGLHGTSTLPLLLGYGCTVPACLATRILPTRRDRFLASVLAALVPCSARSTVILGLVAFYLGPGWALAIYAGNALVVILSGLALTRLWPEISAGMILEVPRYQWPALPIVLRKVWLRLREFVVISWPLLVAGSLTLGLAEYWHWDVAVNRGLAPLTTLLGLPAAVGTTLIFGVLRKELAMVMLMQALGTSAVNTVLTSSQILVFTVFVTFYLPCVATIAALAKEIGARLTAVVAAYTLILAFALSLAARLVLS